MCELSVVMAFAIAHVAAWHALGRGWRGAARAPFVVFVPAVALLLLDAILNDSYANLPLKIGTLVSWQLLCFFGYACLRVAIRQPAATPPRGVR